MKRTPTHGSFFGRISKIGSFWPIKSARKASEAVVPKALLYSGLARGIVEAHPHILPNFLRARQLALQHPNQVVSFANVKLRALTESVGGLSGSNYYRMEIGNNNFFVKEFLRSKLGPRFSPTLEDPATQMKLMVRAGDLIRADPRFSQVIVAEPHFAFNGKNALYLVSQYYDGVAVSKIRENSELARKFGWTSKDEELIENLSGYLEKNGITDVSDYNMLWCKDIHKFVLTDVRPA